MGDPTAHDFIEALALALHGEPMPARPIPPKEVWEELLTEVRKLSGVDNSSSSQSEQ